ncbi:hypothetical protein CMO90_02445 [Candidatus Woesearchaeota archaeon]|jgi:DHA1 family multidrug resistance protein-like MFS transporter|nr:hypothetical protein [Candidatus Woesearchaeota archaeon]
MHHREFVRATGINIFFTFCIFLYHPIIAPYVKSLGLDDFQVGLIFSILPLTIMFFSPIMGRLSDDIGRTRVIMLGLIVEIVAMALYLLDTHWLVILIARFLDALAISSVMFVGIAKVEDSLSNKERGKYAGWSFSLTHIGAIVAPVIGGIIADKIFVRSPFILSAFLLLLLSFIIVSKEKISFRKRVSRKDFNLFDEINFFFSIRQLKGMAILGIVMHASVPAMNVFLPLYIIEKLGLSYTYIGVALFFFGLSHLFQFYFGMLSDRFGRATLTMFGCAIYAFFLFLLSAVNSYSLILLFLFFQGLGRAIWNISAWSFMSDIGERIHKEGEVVGSFMSISKAGGFVSFLFSGLIVQVYGVEKLFILNAFLIALGIIVASLYLDRNLPEKLSKDL